MYTTAYPEKKSGSRRMDSGHEMQGKLREKIDNPAQQIGTVGDYPRYPGKNDEI